MCYYKQFCTPRSKLFGSYCCIPITINSLLSICATKAQKRNIIKDNKDKTMLTFVNQFVALPKSVQKGKCHTGRFFKRSILNRKQNVISTLLRFQKRKIKHDFATTEYKCANINSFEHLAASYLEVKLLHSLHNQQPPFNLCNKDPKKDHYINDNKDKTMLSFVNLFVAIKSLIMLRNESVLTLEAFF